MKTNPLSKERAKEIAENWYKKLRARGAAIGGVGLIGSKRKGFVKAARGPRPNTFFKKRPKTSG